MEKQEILEFKQVSFGYSEDKLILKNVNLKLEKGKTYALVGPTGGGKSTTASLMARLYDPTSGVVEFKNQDIRYFTPQELTTNIGFILQDPFLFSGSVAENIIYGNTSLTNTSIKELKNILIQNQFEKLIDKFENGLETMVKNNANNISIGQKQLIAFMRVLLRKPQLLILDEATANIDTLTEMLLNQIISQLDKTTTKVIIAHRLNTIKEADSIFFINNGQIQPALDFDSALNLINNHKENS